MNKYQENKLEHAFEYALNGWKIMPCGYNKKPLTANGSKDASFDINQIKEWFLQYPNMNLGIATTPESFWVVDVDMKNGKDGIQSLKNQFGEEWDFDIQNHLFAKTPTGGFHFLFTWPEGIDIHNSTEVLSGIDIRGSGGYIVVAPSTIKIDEEFSEPYRWNNLQLSISKTLTWAAKLLEIQTEAKSGFNLKQCVEGIPKGNRDEQIFRYCWHLKAQGIEWDLAKGFILTVCERCVPPFDRSTALQKLETVYQRKE